MSGFSSYAQVYKNPKVNNYAVSYDFQFLGFTQVGKFDLSRSGVRSELAIQILQLFCTIYAVRGFIGYLGTVGELLDKHGELYTKKRSLRSLYNALTELQDQGLIYRHKKRPGNRGVRIDFLPPLLELTREPEPVEQLPLRLVVDNDPGAPGAPGSGFVVCRSRSESSIHLQELQDPCFVGKDSTDSLPRSPDPVLTQANAHTRDPNVIELRPEPRKPAENLPDTCAKAPKIEKTGSSLGNYRGILQFGHLTGRSRAQKRRLNRVLWSAVVAAEKDPGLGAMDLQCALARGILELNRPELLCRTGISWDYWDRTWPNYGFEVRENLASSEILEPLLRSRELEEQLEEQLEGGGTGPDPRGDRGELVISSNQTNECLFPETNIQADDECGRRRCQELDQVEQLGQELDQVEQLGQELDQVEQLGQELDQVDDSSSKPLLDSLDRVDRCIAAGTFPESERADFVGVLEYLLNKKKC